MPTISACLIVKNEEYHLPRCLASLRRTGDEIVLVDTGSTDSTLDIARAAGAKIFHFPWCNDFGAARNESLRHATSDWAVWIDADEELVEAQPGILHQLCRQVPADCVGFWTRCRNLSNERGEVGSIAQQWRIFRNHRQARFYGAIHEQLRLPSGQEVRLVPQEQAFIRHWGYIPRPGVLEQKAARNRTLLEATLRADPGEPFNHYCLGKQLAGENRFAEALPHLENAIRLWRERGQPN
ncbi:MAG: glycosyltransferase family 2 protein, partial [Chloroflexota bacterium]